MNNASDEGREACQRLMNIAFAFCQSQCLFAAVELGIFSLLEGTVLTEQEIGTHANVDQRGRAEFLDSLVALGLLTRKATGYTNAPAASMYLVKTNPFYIGGLLEFMAARLYPVWRRLTEGLQTGLPQNEALEEPDYYANLGADKTRHSVFLNGMTGLSARPAHVIAARFPWRQHKTFVDLGGATGSLAIELLKFHAHLFGVVFDLPSVQPFFETFASNFGDRLIFYAGDFFKDPLPSADVFILGHVLHNWNADQKLCLLSKVYEAVKPGGAIIIYEWLLDESREKLLGLFDSLNMLLVTRTGCSISEGACHTFLQSAGFEGAETFIDDDPYMIVVGRKI
jgi:SAM-dependent methyltransferase